MSGARRITLLLPAGKLLGIAVGELARQLDHLQQLGHLLAPFPAPQALVEGERAAQDVAQALLGIERGARSIFRGKRGRPGPNQPDLGSQSGLGRVERLLNHSFGYSDDSKLKLRTLP